LQGLKNPSILALTQRDVKSLLLDAALIGHGYGPRISF
jgi:hypothetical protein